MQAIQFHSCSVLNLKKEPKACTWISTKSILFSLKYLSPNSMKIKVLKPFKATNPCKRDCTIRRLRQCKTFTSVICNAFGMEDSLKLSSDHNLTIDDAERWNASLQHVVNLGFNNEEAGKVLGKAFGYVNSVYWGQAKSKGIPDPEVVPAILDYLRGLGLSDSDISSLLKKFPELLGCSLETDVKTNVGILESTWGATGIILQNLIMRKPHVLGYNIDCKGDCMAQCTRCWARF